MGATAGMGVGVGPSHIPNAGARASGDRCYHIKQQCLWSSDLENVFFCFSFATGFNHSFIFWGSAWVCSLSHGWRYGCYLTIRLKIQFTLHSALPCCLPLSLTSSAFKTVSWLQQLSWPFTYKSILPWMAVKTGVTSASLGPIFSLTSLVSVTALKCSVSYQPGRRKMQFRAATPDMSGKGVCLQGVQGGQVCWAPPGWAWRGLVLLRVSWLSCLCSGPLILLLFGPCACREPGPAKQTHTRRRGNGTQESQQWPHKVRLPKVSALNRPFCGQEPTPHHALGNDLRPQAWAVGRGSVRKLGKRADFYL